MMDELLRAENLRTYQPGGWEHPFSLTGSSGEKIFIQGTQRKCNYLFELFCGLRLPDEGSVSILGNGLYELPEQELISFRCCHIGGVPYGGGLMPELRLIDQVTLPMRLMGLSEAEIRDRIRGTALGFLPIHSLFNPASCSTERTKALTTILQTTIMGQEVLIFNSPFEELSEIAADLVWQQLVEVLGDNTLFLYLSSNPAPSQVSWTRHLQI